ncbi:uncharacterized protein EV420DRAFT_1154324 [Desarmillaria tabescens]|uniref:Chromo domain-containing protein n=1 Tax=Armillaria tabescens TaxID=1929756 RepID=A0AA39TYG3_ARMTA|nr:uncharacterized protein EV420DRAFT_1154324 [Desarmillaria tabescens]KAK0463080.1 hypothetical protein EV420DRAFT_1154324 [Desarmillaria tabescens]
MLPIRTREVIEISDSESDTFTASSRSRKSRSATLVPSEHKVASLKRSPRSHGPGKPYDVVCTPTGDSSRFPESVLRSFVESQPVPSSITISGQKLTPTKGFNIFWYWCAERKLIDDRRRAGYQAPWTDDTILRDHFFCNTFRVLDQVSQFIIKEVIEKGPSEPREVLFRVLLFNLFTKPATWKYLEEQLGPLTWKSYSQDKYFSVLSKAKKSGVTLYTGAFQKPAPSFGLGDNFKNHLALLEIWMTRDHLLDHINKARYLADIFEFIASFPGMADFTGYQLLLNLGYTELLQFSGMDFVVPGLGAQSGLVKLFGGSLKKAKAKVPGIEVDIIEWMTKHQRYHFERLGLQCPVLGPDNLTMELADVEHAICEVDKYLRMSHPSLKGLHDRTHNKRASFKPSSHYPAKPTLPKAWSHPARKITRVRVERPQIDKRYTVAYIGDMMKDKNGKVLYKVFWENYSDDQATWEPEDELKKDAPLKVEEFLENRRHRH